VTRLKNSWYSYIYNITLRSKKRYVLFTFKRASILARQFAINTLIQRWAIVLAYRSLCGHKS